MPYKTTVLALLQERTELHDTLRRERILLLAVERYACALKTSLVVGLEIPEGWHAILGRNDRIEASQRQIVFFIVFDNSGAPQCTGPSFEFEEEY